MQERHCLHMATPRFEYGNVGTWEQSLNTGRWAWNCLLLGTCFVDGNVGTWEHPPLTFCIHLAICYDFPDWMVGDNNLIDKCWEMSVA